MTNSSAPPQNPPPPFDKDTGTFAQEYTLDDERRMGEQEPSGSVSPRRSQVPDQASSTPDSGRRASFDPETGAVHGSGASAGGGHEGEDPDDDRTGGDGMPLTGAGSTKQR